MPDYYVNTRPQVPSGDHEVHTPGCAFFPNVENALYLGWFASCHGAVIRAKQTYPTANGCFFCSRDCHTG